jgi:hypothetical protein
MKRVIFAIFNNSQRYEEVQDISEYMDIYECTRQEALEKMKPMFGTSENLQDINTKGHAIYGWLEGISQNDDNPYWLMSKPYKVECRHEED